MLLITSSEKWAEYLTWNCDAHRKIHHSDRNNFKSNYAGRVEDFLFFCEQTLWICVGRKVADVWRRSCVDCCSLKDNKGHHFVFIFNDQCMLFWAAWPPSAKRGRQVCQPFLCDDSLHRGISLVSRVAALIKSCEVDLLCFCCFWFSSDYVWSLRSAVFVCLCRRRWRGCVIM